MLNCLLCFPDYPKITVQLVSVTKTEGDYIVLPCNATGNPVPTISWTRNGYPLDRNVNARISFSGRKQQLIITNVNRTDSGEYRCVASSSLGNDTSNASQVDIQCEYNVSLYILTEQIKNWFWSRQVLSYLLDFRKFHQVIY